LRGAGPTRIITDLGVLQPGARCELTLTHLHPGVTVTQVRAATGWDLAVAGEPRQTPPPSAAELTVLRRLVAAKRPAPMSRPGSV
jgi:glutaconate CoA-transferase subunit B